MDRHLEHYGNPVGWIMIAAGGLMPWVVENNAILSLGMTAGFGAASLWFNYQTLKLRKEAAERQRRTEGK